MYVKIRILFLLIIPNALLGQNYFDYYNGINNAKILSGKNTIEKSLKNYYLTFEKFDFVFARDCYNAIELSATAKDLVKLEYFIKRGLKQGITFNQILKIKNVTEFQSSIFFQKILKEKDSLEKVYKNSINWKLRNEIIEMFEQDQKMRAKYYNAFLFKRRKIGREWESLNKQQVERLVEITKKYGFPGEKLIGIDTNEMHSKINNSNFSAGMPIIIFIHHYSQPNKSFSSLLLKEIKMGNIYNEHFATISDFEAKFGKNKFDNYGYFAFKHFPKHVNKKEIDKKREKISLLTINQFKKINKNTLITKFWKRLY